MAIDPNDPIMGVASALAQRGAPQGQQLAFDPGGGEGDPGRSLQFQGVLPGSRGQPLAQTPMAGPEQLQMLLDILSKFRKHDQGWQLHGQ